MTERQIVKNTINHIQSDTVPYVLAMEHGVEEKLDKYYGDGSWREKIRTYIDNVAHIDTIQEKPYGDGHIIDAFGAIWKNDSLGAPIVEKPALDEASFKNYKWPDMSQFTDQVYRQIDRASKPCADDRHYHMIAMGWGLFEQSWRMRGFENVLTDSLLEPEFYEELIARICEYYLGMLKACRDIPAAGYLFGDDWGMQNGTIMSPTTWRKFLKPYWKKIFDEVHYQKKDALCHSCGSVEALIPDLIEIGLDALESVQPEAHNMNPYELKRKYGDKITFYGCLGNQSVIPFGTPAQIKSEIRKLRSEMGRNGGYILAAAKPLQAEIPTENAVAVFETFTEV